MWISLLLFCVKESKCPWVRTLTIAQVITEAAYSHGLPLTPNLMGLMSNRFQSSCPGLWKLADVGHHSDPPTLALWALSPACTCLVSPHSFLCLHDSCPWFWGCPPNQAFCKAAHSQCPSLADLFSGFHQPTVLHSILLFIVCLPMSQWTLSCPRTGIVVCVLCYWHTSARARNLAYKKGINYS